MTVEPFGIINEVCYHDGSFTYVLCSNDMTLTPTPGVKLSPRIKFLRTKIKESKDGKPIGFTIIMSRENGGDFDGCDSYYLRYTQYIPKDGPKEIPKEGLVRNEVSIDLLPDDYPRMIFPFLTIFYWGWIGYKKVNSKNPLLTILYKGWSFIGKTKRREMAQITFWIETRYNKR